jgi:hypothetical protein
MKHNLVIHLHPRGMIGNVARIAVRFGAKFSNLVLKEKNWGNSVQDFVA